MPAEIDVHADLTQLFEERLQLRVPSVETDLVESGLLDSLTFVELLASLEQRYGVVFSLDDLEIENFQSIRRIAEFLRSRNGSLRPAYA